MQRSDDNETVVRKRLEQYKAHRKGTLVPYPADTVITVNGPGKPEQVWACVDAVIASAKSGMSSTRTQVAFDA